MRFATMLIAAVISLALVLFVTSPTPESPPGRVLWGTSFETGNLGRIYKTVRKDGSGLRASAIITTERARTGAHSLKIFLPGESTSTTVNRYQLVANMPEGKPGDDRWYGISVYLDNGWDLSEIDNGPDYFMAALMSFRYTQTTANGPGANIDGRLVDGIPHFASTTILPHHRETGVIVAGPLRKGRWIDFVVHVKWSHSSDGLRELWQDGLKIGEYHGPTLAVNSRFEYRVGLYEGTHVNNNRTLYIDNERVGTSYAAVDPSR